MEMAVDVVQRRGLVVALWLHTAVDPPQDEWQRACDRLNELKKSTPDFFTRFRSLVITDGGGPNLKQRGIMNVDVLGSQPSKMVALTVSLSNPIKRGLVKALTWTNPSFRATGPELWREGLAHIDMAGENDLFFEFARLEPGLSSPVQTLALIKKSITGGG